MNFYFILDSWKPKHIALTTIQDSQNPGKVGSTASSLRPVWAE